MTENITRPYSLRLKERFAWFDSVVSQQMHEWAAGSIVTDQTMIALLESIHAPTEKICEGSYLR
jgi:hypothetical protein